jgi:hypothetical protein
VFTEGHQIWQVYALYCDSDMPERRFIVQRETELQVYDFAKILPELVQLATYNAVSSRTNFCLLSTLKISTFCVVNVTSGFGTNVSKFYTPKE